MFMVVFVFCNWNMYFCFRLNGKEKDLSSLENRLMSAESQVNELQARVSDAVNQRRHFEDEYNVSILRIVLQVICNCSVSVCY